MSKEMRDAIDRKRVGQNFAPVSAAFVGSKCSRDDRITRADVERAGIQGWILEASSD